MASTATTAGFPGAALRAVLVRPRLWGTALRQAGRLAAPGWWRRAPFLPVPDPDYLAFRMETQYGSAGHAPAAADLLAYLEWCRTQERARRVVARNGREGPGSRR